MATQQFTSNATWTVPEGNSSVTIRVYGAGGGDAWSYSPGPTSGANGGYAEATVSVSRGDDLRIWVANGGDDGNDYSAGYGGSGRYDGGDGADESDAIDPGTGGGGGGSTEVRNNTTGQNLLGAGGGGGGSGRAPQINDVEFVGAGGGGARGGTGGIGTSSQSPRAGSGGGSGSPSGGHGCGENVRSAQPGAGVVWNGSNTSTSSGGGNSGDGLVEIEYTAPPPATPNNAQNTVEGDDSATATWDEDTSSGNPAHYDVEISEDGGSWTRVATEITSTAYTASLASGTDTVQFRARAGNSSGSSDWTTTGTKSTNITSVTISNVTESSFDLAWDAVDDATEYDVLLAEASGGAESDYTVDQTVTGTSATVSGLENGERYFARVIARYPSADSLSTVEETATIPLPTLTLDSLDASTEREVTINYTLSDNSTDGDVLVEVSTDDGSTWSEAGVVSDLSATSFTHTGLLDGERYRYRLIRRTDHAESVSGESAAMTILPPPLDLTHPSVGVTTADYDWTPQHNNGDTKVQYKPTDASEWQTYSTVARAVTQATVDGLRNFEAYDSRVVAATEHTTTEGQ